MDRRSLRASWMVAVGALVGASLSAVPQAQAAGPPEVRMVMDINPGTVGSSSTNIHAEASPDMADVAGTLFFVADDGEHGPELWRSDGTEAGTRQVTPLEPNEFRNFGTLIGVGDKLFFTANGSDELWVSDGTAAGTFEVRNRFDGGPFEPDHLTPVGNRLFFTAAGNNGVDGRELWVSDGTAAGTSVVADLQPGTAGGLEHLTSTPQHRMAGTDAVAYFNGNVGGAQLWRSDGTTGGTKVVANSTGGALDPEWLTTIDGDTVYFGGNAAGGDTLYASDGTEAGTIALAEPGTAPQDITDVAGDAYFTGSDDDGRELWTSDGTDEGTMPLADINADAASSSPQRLTAVGDTLYFTANDGRNGRQLWQYDPAVGSATMVKNVDWGDATFENDTPRELTAVGDTLFFRGATESGGRHLWSSDGTARGTAPLTSINPAGSAPSDLTQSGGRLFFTADDGVHGRELWVAEPATAGDLADNGVLDAKVTAASPQNGLNPVVVADCQVQCTVQPRGTYVIRKRPGKVVKVLGAGVAGEGGPGRVVGKLKPKGKQAKRAVRRALAAGKVVKAKVTVEIDEVVGSDGGTRRFTVKLRQ